jgi:dihydrofolate synthase/folylpolyglutamate synthase
MTYPEAIKYLGSFVNYEKKSAYPYKESFKLERIKDFLKIIDNPQDCLKYIHIAGTKGKGSVCAFTAFILREAGYKVGLYTSPHLSDPRERIRILNPKSKTQNPKIDLGFEGMISRKDLVSLVRRLKPAMDQYCRQSKYGPLSFFEVYTVLAFRHFKEQKVDFAVLETGLGGRLDATNVIQPLVCGITSISYDHTKQLGSTLTEIAQEKTGIIKAQSKKRQAQKLIVVTAAQEKEVLSVIRSKCKETRAILYEVGKDICFHKINSGINGQSFRLSGLLGGYENLKIRLLGEHQLINAALAVGLLENLVKSHGIKVRPQEIKNGLYNTLWPARCEIITGPALIMLDGAHNAASAKCLKATLAENFPDKKILVILGISRDKDIPGICRELAVAGREFILARASNPRAADPRKLRLILKANRPEAAIILSSSVKEALKLGIAKADKDSLILVTGSLFLVGQARGLLTPHLKTKE